MHTSARTCQAVRRVVIAPGGSFLMMRCAVSIEQERYKYRMDIV